MGLASHGLAFLLGYLLGRPEGRQQFVELRQQVTELARKPEVKRLGERGRDLAGEGAMAAKNAVSAMLPGNRRPSEPAPQEAGSDTAPDESTRSNPGRAAPSGFSGTTPVEDTQAVITGIPAPPPAGRTPPRSAEAD